MMGDLPFCQGADWKSRKSTKEPGTCGACGKPLEGRLMWFCRTPKGEQYGDSCRARYMQSHDWGEARNATVRRDDSRCCRCGEVTDSPEVNHIVPREGQGYRNGCHHHQDNLETLCHACHLFVTAEQRGHVPGGKVRAERERRAERDKAKLQCWQEAAKR